MQEHSQTLDPARGIRTRAKERPTTHRSALYQPRGSRQGIGPVLDWEHGYRSAVIAADIAVILLVTIFATAVALNGQPIGLHAEIALPTAAALLLALPARRAWATNILGQGAEEFRRLGLGLFTGSVAIALVWPLLFPLNPLPWLFVAIPATGATLLFTRYALRRRLHRARRLGKCMLPVLAAGSKESIRDLLARTKANTHVGWHVEAACVLTSNGAVTQDIDGVPVIGGLDRLAELVRRGGYRVVAVTPDSYWTPQRVQRLSWDLEGTSAELVVAPVVMEVGGPRLEVSGVFGMPMLRVSRPVFAGWRRAVKDVTDRLGAAFLIAVASPVLLAAAVAIKLTSPGPVFYCQQRVKRDGELFRMWKFRTMRVGADTELAELAEQNESDGPLFKIRDDPRVTRVGKVLRRYSVDELPQLFNVLDGSMSLVGPRPPLQEETEQYGPDARRRLLVKPGITGLWQVSGRADLSWEDSVRLDLRYVDDWSLALDAVILWKTVRAVLSGNGAY